MELFAINQWMKLNYPLDGQVNITQCLSSIYNWTINFRNLFSISLWLTCGQSIVPVNFLCSQEKFLFTFISKQKLDVSQKKLVGTQKYSSVKVKRHMNLYFQVESCKGHMHCTSYNSVIEAINSLSIANELATLPLVTLRNLLSETPVHSKDGVRLRRIACNRDVINTVLKCMMTNNSKTKKQPVNSGSKQRYCLLFSFL